MEKKMREVIQENFNENISYMNPKQAVNQADSITALSLDLYTDTKRFIYELLQNADDSSHTIEGVKVWIKFFDDKLVVAHSGKSFDEKDIQGICNINNGTKKSDMNKTGYKGIGFKSVFGQSNNVMIYTNGEFFRFDSSYDFPWKWAGTQQEWEHKKNRVFQYPWQIIPIYTEVIEVQEEIKKFISETDANVATILEINDIEDVINGVKELFKNINMFIFLKNITEINFENQAIRIDRSSLNKIILTKGEELGQKWIIKNIELCISGELKNALSIERNIPPKLLEANSLEMTFAIQIEGDKIIDLDKNDKVLYSYLPTEEMKYDLPVLVNTNFLISANRESIHKDSKWNQWLFECISYEIFKWISELIFSEISFEAYKLIPKEEILNDGLAEAYNKGIKRGKEEVAFLLARNNIMIKIDEAIIDFTQLSEKNFIGENSIRNYLLSKKSKNTNKFYVKKCDFWGEFKKLGVTSFEWSDFKNFLMTPYFKEVNSIQKNIELIKYLKLSCNSQRVSEVTEAFVSNIPFILDHKNNFNYPKQVCFPTDDDENWNDIKNELSFVHKDILEYLMNNLDVKNWLESIGVKERTDITYITQNILPNVEHYINENNAISEIQKLFLLYKRGELEKNLIEKLSKIKIMTSKNSLMEAFKCYLSDFYNPRLKLEKALSDNVFVSDKYCSNIQDKEEWKYFFKMLGVKEGINLVRFNENESKNNLLSFGIKKEFFRTNDMEHKPYVTKFWADEFSGIISINLLNYIEDNSKLSFLCWKDFIENNTLSEELKVANSFWGNQGMQGRMYGNKIKNYLPWFIENVKCIPTVDEKIYRATEVYLNTKEIEFVSGPYLPVFKGSELTQEWKSFFNFKTKLELEDYLKVLSQIWKDTESEGNLKKKNYERIQKIYSIFLDECVNWSKQAIERVQEWSKTNKLMDSKGNFTQCNDLYYFVDGNEAIFQEKYTFIKLNAKNKIHQNLKVILSYFQVKLLKQSEFKLIDDNKEACDELKIKLINIIPYFEMWIKHDKEDNGIEQKVIELRDKVKGLECYQSKELKITYDEMGFTKFVSLHFDENKLYVTTPWNSNSVLVKLAEILCIYFEIEGLSTKLDFLLRAEVEEIQRYFIQEEIEVPVEYLINDEKPIISDYDGEKEKNLSQDFFEETVEHSSRKKYIQSLIPRAVRNVIEHLNVLPEYDCTRASIIAESVIGGITKNGNDIKVVARPSDNDKIRLYYDSEFDVLEYTDAEIWYEDGNTPPKQFTLGQLLKMTKINKIPIKRILTKDIEINNPKSEILDFDAIPFSPEKIAKVISAFANTNGGTIIFGIKELSNIENEIVGLSNDFNMTSIINKAIAMIEPIPDVIFDWVKKGEEFVFVIEVEKANEDIFLNNKKYIRESTNIILVDDINRKSRVVNTPQFNRTLAIIISIEDYVEKARDRIPSVKYANNDADKFKSMLTNKLKMKEEDIIVLKNEQALKTVIEDEIQYNMHSIGEEDRLIFYFVGHGFHNGVTNYISTYDMKKTDIANTTISLRKLLLDPLKNSKCKNALIFIDACAQSFVDENSRSTISNINEDELRVFSNEFPHYAVFLSCQDGEKSYSCDEFKNGIWTYYLTEAVNKAVDSVVYKDKYITDRKLGDYLSLNVAEYAKKNYNWNQNPKIIIDSSYENVIITLSKEIDEL